MRNRYLLPLLLLCPIAGALAQDLANLTVTVADPSAAIVPDAKVVLTDLNHGAVRNAATAAQGFAIFDSLPASDYTLEVEKAGFSKFRLKITLALRDRQTVRVQLEVAAATGAAVNVTDKAEIVSSDAAQGASFGQEYIQNLPINGRNAESLVLMAPGVTSAGSGDGSFNVNGLRSNTNYYTIDGVSVNLSVGGAGQGPAGNGGGGRFGGGAQGDGGPAAAASIGSSTGLISIDAMQEMRVQTSSFAPEFGRTPGAQVVMSSRSGTNAFHGSAFYYYRNDRFDANDWFANAGGFGRGAEHQNRPGATFGGPLVKDKTFFFVSFEQLDLTSPFSVVSSVPSAATIAASPASLRPYLLAFPTGNGELLLNGAQRYRAVVSNPAKSDSGSGRLDQVITSKIAAFVRYSYTPSSSDQRGSETSTPNILTHNDSTSQSATGGVTQSLKAGSINDIRVNYSKFSSTASSSMDSFGGATPLLPTQLFPKGIDASNGTFNLNIFGSAGLTYAGYSSNAQTQYNVVDSFTRLVGPHSIKLGVDYRRILATNGRKPYSESVSFNGLTTNTYSLITGQAINARVTANTPNVYPTYSNLSSYAQDTWRVTQWTTITYGVRWDVNPAPTSRQGQQPFALSNDSIAGVTQNDPIYKTRWYDVAPRFGVAYNMDERQGREMMLRAGIGMFYDLGYGNVGQSFNGAPFSNVRTLTVVSFPLSLVNVSNPGLPPTRPYGQVFAADTALQSPLVTQWNLTWERYFGTGQLLTVGYVGTLGRRLSEVSTQPAYTPAFDVLTAVSNGGSSNYNGMQVQFRRRFSNTFQAQLSYTWSHSIDTSSTDAGGGGFASINGAGDHASSDFDIRQNLNFSGSYRLPAPAKGIAFAPIRNWYFDFVETWRTGLPFTIQGLSSSTSGTTTTVIGSTTVTTNGLFALVRPDYLGQQVWTDDPKVPGGRRLNLATFSTPTTFSQGNLSRNELRGFGATQLDLSLRKTIPLTERWKLSLAAQGFNILNHPNFANVSPFEGGNMSSPDFGIVSRMLNQSFGGGVNSLYRAGGPRSMEFSIRLQF